MISCRLKKPCIDFLPCPSSHQDLKALEKDGVFFNWKTLDTKGEGLVMKPDLKPNTMIPVTMPKGYGLWLNSEHHVWRRCDIIDALVLNSDRVIIASLNWIVRGPEDYSCSIIPHPVSISSMQLDPSRGKLDPKTGWYRAIPSTNKTYHNMVNDYYKKQHHGEDQEVLNNLYKSIKQFENAHQIQEKINYPKLYVLQRPRNTEFESPFPFEDTSPWVNYQPIPRLNLLSSKFGYNVRPQLG